MDKLFVYSYASNDAMRMLPLMRGHATLVCADRPGMPELLGPYVRYVPSLVVRLPDGPRVIHGNMLDEIAAALAGQTRE